MCNVVSWTSIAENSSNILIYEMTERFYMIQSGELNQFITRQKRVIPVASL